MSLENVKNKTRFRLCSVLSRAWIILAPVVLWGQEQAEMPRFGTPRGFYQGPVQLTLEADESPAQIHFTLDGADPTSASPQYRGPIALNETAVVRARTFAPYIKPSPITTHTYVIGGQHTLPVVSLVSDPRNLWDNDVGIFAFGDNPGRYPYLGANFYQDWERPIHLEFFTANGEAGFHLDAGAKVHGGQGSRPARQKSLAIFARKQYGPGRIQYQIFPDKEIDRFESIVLRNSGNDWARTQFRDALTVRLVRHTGLDVLAYRPVVAYLNGEYWGIYNIREKINEHYLADNHGVDPDSLDLLEFSNFIIHGDNEHYKKLINFVARQNMELNANYAEVKRRMDVDSYLNYLVAQIFVGNTDWPAGNIKFWRPQTESGRWRWILFDTDFGFGLKGSSEFIHNTLDFATTDSGADWPNPPWSTFLVRSLLENRQFRDDLIGRFADHLNSTFRTERVLAVIEEMEDVLEPEIPAFMARWQKTVGDWQGELNTLRTFARFRPLYMRRHIEEKFALNGQFDLAVEVWPPGTGIIQVNSLAPESFPWEGTYFEGVPVRLQAVAKGDFVFSGWRGIAADSSAVFVESAPAQVLQARFVPAVSPVVINEINYHSADDFDPGDWLELYNTSAQSIDMTNWIFRDSDDEHTFVLPATLLQPAQFLVLCRDRAAFRSHFPETECLGDLGFGLGNSGELLRLFDAEGALVDSLTYSDEDPWPTEPDGGGASLALRAYGLANSLPTSWTVSSGHGTPGLANQQVRQVDFDGDGQIDMRDFFLFLEQFGQQGSLAERRFDLDDSGRVGLADFFLFLEQFTPRPTAD
ncbi:MAG: hypothetical protein GKR89_10925 [Candidatus Latescibacteria bacterium]|nr:hypothetical protein [Candidatus Latescibacterota bacterium]